MLKDSSKKDKGLKSCFLKPKPNKGPNKKKKIRGLFIHQTISANNVGQYETRS